jgi:hypothetical protein
MACRKCADAGQLFLSSAGAKFIKNQPVCFVLGQLISGAMFLTTISKK